MRISSRSLIYTLSLHDALPIYFESLKKTLSFSVRIVAFITIPAALGLMILREPIIRVLFQHGQFVAESTRLTARSEEHTSELQSRGHLVCRLLLEKKTRS